MIIRLALPERFSGALQNLVGFPRCRSLQRFQKDARRDHRQVEPMNMVRHDRERPKLIMPELHAAIQRINHDFRHFLLPKEHRTTAPGVEISVHPGESLTRRGLCEGWESPRRDAAVESPGHEQPAAFRIAMRQAAARIHKSSSVLFRSKFSRSHECERGTHECVRHTLSYHTLYQYTLYHHTAAQPLSRHTLYRRPLFHQQPDSSGYRLSLQGVRHG